MPTFFELHPDFEALFRRPEGHLNISGGDGFEVHARDASGWLGTAHDLDLDRALAECAALVDRNLAALDGRVPIRVRMSELMRTGTFGPVVIGMTDAEVEAALGPPEDMMFSQLAPPDYRQAPIWTYHDIEFYFDDPEDGPRRLTQISRSALMYHVEAVDSRALEIDFDFLVDGERPSIDQVKSQAKDLGLEWEELVAFGERILVLSSGVCFMFADDPDDDGAVYIGINPDHIATVRAGRYG